MTKLIALCCGILLLAAPPLGAGEPLTMTVSPTFAFQPTDIVVRTFVARNAVNRAIRVIAESTDFYTSSEVQLEGDQAPISRVFRFRAMPAGDYTVTVLLIGQGGKELAAVAGSVFVS